ncbi:MAG: site-specific DNA-methyltransferase [Candidatus Parvarchaeota archaeon]
MNKDHNQLGNNDITLKDAVDNVIDQQEIEGPNIEISEQKEFFKVPKKFGTVPVDELPLGYTKGKEYRDKFPRINLPFQKIEEISFGNPELEPKNKLFWGDNLHIMRMLPSESIDLIYIDPPFFSGRNYNVIFGDENEIRSFSDIWDGGMPTYLIWLNARLLEMKRLLKPTGSIYVHLDWHAVHYVKVEMDKIFGYDNFRNEIIWDSGSISGFKSQKKGYIRRHDVILYYVKNDNFIFNKQYLPYKEDYVKKMFVYKDTNGRLYRKRRNGKQYLDESKGMPISDVWNDIYSIQTITQSKEVIGYPTQKPEALLERIIKASSNEGDVVADFFCGGGTTPAVAQRLGRRWIASDISRIAVEITKGRILKLLRGEGGGWVVPENTPNMQVYSWGYYDIPSLSKYSEEEFKDFIIAAFGAQKISDSVISGLKGGVPVWIGPKDHEAFVTEDDVIGFAQYLNDHYETKKRGIMVAWQFSEKAKKAKEMLAQLGAGIDFVTIDLVNIGSKAFKEHVTSKHPEYETLLRFIMPPVVRMTYKRKGNLEYEFDFSESVSLNNGRIINIQADFNYEKNFVPTSGYAFTGNRDKATPPIISYKFSSPGLVKIAFKVEDDQGGEALLIKEIEVS